MSKKAKAIVKRFRKWKPETTPLQFTARYNPYNHGSPKKEWLVDQSELSEDSTAPFFSEAYLYNLLGKEDARSLLYAMEELFDIVEGRR
jgi:hypothetical protein